MQFIQAAVGHRDHKRGHQHPQQAPAGPGANKPPGDQIGQTAKGKRVEQFIGMGKFQRPERWLAGQIEDQPRVYNCRDKINDRTKSVQFASPIKALTDAWVTRTFRKRPTQAGSPSKCSNTPSSSRPVSRFSFFLLTPSTSTRCVVPTIFW